LPKAFSGPYATENGQPGQGDEKRLSG
jgi:hypothetical protein